MPKKYSRLRHWILDGTEVKPVSFKEWLQWMMDNVDNAPEGQDGRRVAETTFPEYWVSTVFLGLDHRFTSDGPPILFETMIFRTITTHEKRGEDFYQCRYSTWNEAVEGHNRIVRRIEKGWQPNYESYDEDEEDNGGDLSNVSE